MGEETGQLYFCAFLLVSWPRFSICSLAFHEGIETKFPGDTARKGSAQCLRLESLELAMGKKRRLGSKQSVSHFAKWKRTVHPLSWACWLSESPDSVHEYFYMGIDFFPESNPTEKFGKQRGIHPTDQHDGHYFSVMFHELYSRGIQPPFTFQPKLLVPASAHWIC